MRDRLVELFDYVREHPEKTCPQFNRGCTGCKFEKLDDCGSDRLADHLLANGVIVLPCKVGDKIYFVDEVCDENANEYLDINVGEVVSFSIQKEGLWMYCRYENGLTYWHLVADELGKTVFLTREEAEAKLKEGEQG